MTELAKAIENFCRKKQTIPLDSRLLLDWVLSLCPLHQHSCTCTVFISSEVLRQIIHPAYLALKPPEDKANGPQYGRDAPMAMPRWTKITLAKWLDATRKQAKLAPSIAPNASPARAAAGLPYILERNPEIRPFADFSERLLETSPRHVIFLIRLQGDFNFAFVADLERRRLEVVTCVHSKLEYSLVAELERCVIWFVLFQFSRLMVPTRVIRIPEPPGLHYCTVLTIFYTFLRIRKRLSYEQAGLLCTEQNLVQFMQCFFDPDCKELVIGQ